MKLRVPESGSTRGHPGCRMSPAGSSGTRDPGTLGLVILSVLLSGKRGLWAVLVSLDPVLSRRPVIPADGARRREGGWLLRWRGLSFPTGLGWLGCNRAGCNPGHRQVYLCTHSIFRILIERVGKVRERLRWGRPLFWGGNHYIQLSMPFLSRSGLRLLVRAPELSTPREATKGFSYSMLGVYSHERMRTPSSRRLRGASRETIRRALFSLQDANSRGSTPSNSPAWETTGHLLPIADDEQYPDPVPLAPPPSGPPRAPPNTEPTSPFPRPPLHEASHQAVAPA